MPLLEKYKMEWVNMNLKRAALIKVATCLWKHVYRSDIFFKAIESDVFKWHLFEDTCIKNVDNLLLPNELEIEIKIIVRPISYEVRKFVLDHLGALLVHYYTQHKMLDIFYTARGTVDRRRTLKVLIDDEDLDLQLRFRVACRTCLTNDISALWNRMSEKIHHELLNFYDIDNLEDIWSLQLSGNEEAVKQKASEDGFESDRIYTLFRSLDMNNLEAVEFYWNQLPAKERDTNLFKALKQIKCHVDGTDCSHLCRCTEVVLFLLSHSGKESLKSAMESEDFSVPDLLSDWPWQEYDQLTVESPT